MNLHPTNKDMTSFGNLSRAELMSRVRSRDNKTTERRMAILLREAGLTGWRRNVMLLGKPDFVWLKLRVALFVDGCFWHGHDCGRNLTPKNNVEHWERKLRATRQRDTAIRRELRRKGWSVIGIWECDLKRVPITCVHRVRSVLRRRSARN